MVAIVTRAGKGSPLTNAEVDANFANLNSGKVENTQAGILAALGYTPYNSTNPSAYVDAAGARAAISATGSLSYNSTTGVMSVNVPVTSVAGKIGDVTLSTSDVSEGTRLYYTDARARAAISATGSLSYNSMTGVMSVSVPVTSVFGRTGAVTLASSDVTGALGYTPYDSSNPSGYITSAPLASYLPKTGGSISGDGYIDFGPNSSWGATLRVGGNGNGGTARASVATTNGNLHLDGSASRGVYLNWYSTGTPGTYFGNGGGGQVGQIDGSGNASFSGNVTANSDERLKTDWTSLSVDFIERLARVKSGTYTRTDSGVRQAGSSAQDWQNLLPEVVMVGQDEAKTLSLAYGNAALVAAVELAKRLLEVDGRLRAIEQRTGA